ncbi:plasmid maintenance system killer protein [Spirochaetales bacterium NM-380-WT-3C1]|uniref:Plasmid maintenance system killer protein n=1 Tax=Bullifex porci TaxID=2606638 RepID=A0A7X2TPK5_9SPIO|nr:type II toxin-antitoxin system RelE/ParE family toxin [Bullifex porci]MSU05541.1 plasmid maintenance system killer protein [Bullifex porci]
MDIKYKNNSIKKICTNATIAERTYGREMADKIHQRIDEIAAADTVEMLIQFHIGRCHPLTQNRKGQYAMDLVQPYRLVFEKNGDEIQIANILEIVDYH